jgi:protein-L-isoaspartate(D-aspartate) O-methyltransferase
MVASAFKVLALVVAAGTLVGCPKREPGRSPGATSDAVASTTSESKPQPAAAAARPGVNERVQEREALVRVLADDGITNPRVLNAMRRVPRHRFVPEAVRDAAYENRPLPIGNGQTISQPYIVAAMTQAAAPEAQHKCLEIGTGSGYQAAVLAELCAKVYSIEYLVDVAAFGRDNLRAAGYSEARVALRVGDGYRGWPEAAPFDVILVTAAPEHVPKPLLEQLAMNGKLVIPVGPESGVQELERWTRTGQGSADAAFRRETLMGVRFVPFLGEGVKGAH